jgi:ribosomal protein S18 acetylase RimI-like enzyme
MALRVRAAVFADYSHFVAMQHVLGLDNDPPDEATWQSRLCPRAFFLVDDDEQIVGYGLGAAYGTRGDVRQVAVAPAWQGQGIGRQIMAIHAERLRAAGCERWGLEVLHDNVRALALYRRVGLRPVRDIYSFRIATAALWTRVRGPDGSGQGAVGSEGLGDIVTTVAESGRFAAIERQLELLPGKLAGLAVRTGIVAHVAYDRAAPGRIRGYARFVPDLAPGRGLVFPYRATDELGATAALAALLATASPLPAELELEARDPFVTAVCRAAGADAVHHLVEMEGPIPSAAELAALRPS